MLTIERTEGTGSRSRPGLLAVAAFIFWACGDGTSGPPAQTIQPRAIVFISDRDGDFDLYAMNPDGADVVQLTNAPGSDQTPRWSPDGRRIAFASDRDGSSAIYVMTGDGTDVTRLANGSLPSWSPDGRELAFYDQNRIKIMSVDGTGVREVTGQANVDGLDWEPNGDRIAFGYPDLVFIGFEVNTEVVDVDGTNRAGLLMISSNPSWSPDGSRVATLQNSMAFRISRVAVITLPEGPTQPLAQTPARSRPAWAPDGSQVLYTKLVLTEGVANEEIFVALASGAGSPRQVTTHTGNDRDPDWRR